jgi:hypothetical protein
LSSAPTSFLLPLAGALAGYLILVFANPAYRYFRDGLRCVQRHPRMWVWFCILALAYNLFQLLQVSQLREAEFSIQSLLYWPAFHPPDWYVVAQRAWLPALELLAGIFNQAVVSYPVSALAALLFLLNWQNHRRQFLDAAKRRLGRWWLAIYAGLLLCAVAALLKPIFSLAIYWLNQYLGGVLLLRSGAVIDLLSFQFEYLFGLLVQIALVLQAFVWIRGLNATPARILELAVKRIAYAAKWAGCVLGAALLFIHLPLLVSYLWIAEHTDFTNGVVQYVEQTARPLLAMGLLLFCPMQIALILHNETLREAVLEHARLSRKHWYRVFWFLFVSGFHLFAISCLGYFFAGGFPRYSVPNVLLLGFFGVWKAFFAAWFLAGWVCLYRACSNPVKEIRF